MTFPKGARRTVADAVDQTPLLADNRGSLSNEDLGQREKFLLKILHVLELFTMRILTVVRTLTAPRLPLIHSWLLFFGGIRTISRPNASSICTMQSQADIVVCGYRSPFCRKGPVSTPALIRQGQAESNDCSEAQQCSDGV